MSEGSHDTLVYRLASTLIKLNNGEHINPKLLADEYGVTLRTIQRDLNVRFAYLPLQKTNGRYHIDPFFLGKLTRQDIERFASLAGVKGLFPSLSDEFFEQIFDKTRQSSILVKGHSYEKLDGQELKFRQLEESISASIYISFVYKKDTHVVKTYQNLRPYKLINNKGIWYLAAIDGDKEKTFSFTKIDQLQLSDNYFKPEEEIKKLIDEDNSIWFSKKKIKVVLKISSQVSAYFLRRELIANQVIDEQFKDGGLLLSVAISHVNQILPIIKYWIPHIEIIKPKELKLELLKDVKAYLKTL